MTYNHTIQKREEIIEIIKKYTINDLFHTLHVYMTYFKIKS